MMDYEFEFNYNVDKTYSPKQFVAVWRKTGKGELDCYGEPLEGITIGCDVYYWPNEEIDEVAEWEDGNGISRSAVDEMEEVKRVAKKAIAESLVSP